MSRWTRRICHSLFVGALVWFSACAPKQVVEEPVSSIRPSESPKSTQIEPQARKLYFQGERAFNSKNYEQAIRLFQLVRSKYPGGRAALMSTYRLGTMYYYREDFSNATREFEYFLSKFPQSELAFDVNYNLAAAYFQSANYEKAYEALGRFKLADIQAQGPRRAEVVYRLTAQTAAALGNHAGAIAAYAMEMQLPIQEQDRSEIEKKVDTHLVQIHRKSDLERLLRDLTEPVTRAKTNERLNALAAMEAKGAAAAEGSITTVPSTGVTGAAPIAPGMGGNGEKLNVGVVLPLTGRWSAYGRRALDGILLASKVFQPSRDLEIHLFIQDTASNPLLAAQAVDELFHKYRVGAIIGPFNWRESQAVAERAQELGVLNLSLTAKEGILEKGTYLFQNALTPRVQLENLVRYCITERHFQRFGILAPNNGFGKDMTNEFWTIVENYGGRVVAYQTYAPGEKDFQAHIQEMAGLSNPKDRQLELTKIADFLAEQKAKATPEQKAKAAKEARAGKEPKIQLPPIVDFDALFIPDSPKTVAQIAPSLAYFNVTGVSLLGTTEWNSDQLYKRGGKYVEGSIFPGALNLSSKNSRQREFVRLYTEAYGSTPDLLAAQAYEAMEIVAATIRRSASNERNEMVNQMLNLKDFDTSLGTISFDANRIAKRRLPIFTLEPGGAIFEQQ